MRYRVNPAALVDGKTKCGVICDELRVEERDGLTQVVFLQNGVEVGYMETGTRVNFSGGETLHIQKLSCVLDLTMSN